jgi:ribosome recycling factor
MIDDIAKDADQRMEKSVNALNQEFIKIRTGRAHSSLLDHVHVEYYGAEVPIGHAANITTEDARTLSVRPWDKNMVKPIEKAILNSDLGLNPSTAGTVIRIILPPLTEERRRDLVRVVRAEAENARVAVRSIRRDANQSLKDAAKEKIISDDDARHGEQNIQKITDRHVARIDETLADKEQEMLEM